MERVVSPRRYHLSRCSQNKHGVEGKLQEREEEMLEIAAWPRVEATSALDMSRQCLDSLREKMAPHRWLQVAAAALIS